jgi:hypothetical protein
MYVTRSLDRMPSLTYASPAADQFVVPFRIISAIETADAVRLDPAPVNGSISSKRRFTAAAIRRS